jgi:hypothetical protein
MDQRARHSRCSRNPFRAGHGFRGYSGSQLLRPVRLLAPQYGPDRSPGQRGLLLPGFQRVGRPSAAGYDYNSVWTPLLAGPSPAGMAASLAALVRPCSRPASTSGSRPTYSITSSASKSRCFSGVFLRGRHHECNEERRDAKPYLTEHLRNPRRISGAKRRYSPAEPFRYWTLTYVRLSQPS